MQCAEWLACIARRNARVQALSVVISLQAITMGPDVSRMAAHGPDPAARLRLVLGEHQDRILREWTAEVRRIASPQDLSDAVILDHLPQILAQITRLLEPGQRAQWSSLAQLGEAHALDRLSRGFGLDQVVLEYRVLRRIIASAWSDAVGETIAIPELMVLDEAFDESVSQAVVKYARSRERLLSGLNQVSEAAARSGSLEDFLQALLHATVETLAGVDTAAVMVREGDDLHMRAAIGLEQDLRDQFHLRVGEGFAGRVASLATPLEISDAANDAVVRSPAIRARGVHALYGVPLLQQGQVIGVAHIGSIGAQAFTDENKLLFRTMASRAASYLGKARLQSRLRHAEAAQRTMSEVSRHLAETRDLESALAHVSRIVVPALADWCVIDLLEPQGPRRVSMAHSDPGQEALAQQVDRDYPLDLNGGSAIARALRLGRTDYIPEVTEEAIATAARDARHLSFLKDLGVRSAIVVPVQAHQSTLGAITLAYASSGRRYAVEDIAIAEDLARRLATAIENARLYREASEAVQARDRLLAIVSHDLRNQLGIIGNAMHSLEKSSRGVSSESVERSLALVKRASTNMHRLVGDLVDSAAIHAGRFLVALRPVPIDELIAAAVELQRPTAAEHDIRLSLELAAPGIAVLADPERMHQVLANLLGNAIRYAGRSQQVSVTSSADERYVTVCVVDTGPGIPDGDHRELFKPYRSMPRSGKTGTGLGLYISKGIVERQGGRIEVESRLGEGTTFRFTVPRLTR
jgi:signal transduction histidine kinase/putative methionine-R-sulfoxide reductase with GAF domain